MIILLQQFTLVSCRRVREIGCFSIPRAQRTDLCSHGDRFCQASLEEQTRKDARIQNAINSSLKLVSKLHLWSLRSQSPRCLSNGWNQAAGGGQMIAPILLRKGTDESGTFSKKNAHNECSPFPREQSVHALTPHMRIGRVWHLLSKVLTQIATFLKRFKLTLQKQTSPEDKKEDDVFQRGPFIPAVARLLTPMSSALLFFHSCFRHRSHWRHSHNAL